MMNSISSNDIGRTLGKFTWNFSMYFFIETSIGNFVYSSPDYNGDGSIRHYEGTSKDFFGDSYGRSKGIHLIGEYCKGFTYNGDTFKRK